MRVFISAGEPSGDLHGANLIKALRQKNQNLEIIGFGGTKMQEEGASLLAHCDQLEVMGFNQVLLRLPQFIRWVGQAARMMRLSRPHAVVLIDFPGFNWWIAQKAKDLGIPVMFFVPPQIWAWAGWRINKMRRLVDRVLCNFPFEEKWYQERGVDARLVGHPYFYELNKRSLSTQKLELLQGRGGRKIAILPGSRRQELQSNGPTLLATARNLRAKYPDVHFEVACLRPAHAQTMSELGRALQLPHDFPIQYRVDCTPEIISKAWACMSVSGSVSLELLHQALPSQIVYQSSAHLIKLARIMMNCKYISLPNLLAEEEVFPESFDYLDLTQTLTNRMSGWLDSPDQLEGLRNRLKSLWSTVFHPGACDRAAAEVLNMINQKKVQRAG